MIQIKDRDVMRAILTKPYHSTLVDVLFWLDEMVVDDIIFTSGFRPKDSKCHGTIPCRAVDLRSWVFKHPYGIRDFINRHWQYDSTRPGLYKVAKYHKVENGGWHFHIQVHDNTRRREQ